MDNKKKLLSEFKESTQMEKFNFIASIVTVSGVSIFTVLSGIEKIDTFKIGVYLILFATLLLIVSFLIGLYYFVITSIKKDLSPNVFYLVAFILTLFAVGFLLIIVTSGWDFISSVNIHS
ncbi:hypothetical protein LIS82_27360 (plasmid) [Cytobacillus solani]|uniref:hypothetical protein n=1 Tax=Cytobacillus solani TaxID=1637975 RepID=UPI00207AD6B8|nr:hypothetical protein [Cytobacillus solani]USK57701.1 hypothetical protein LIS82_27360 [Cytobacillus solani]